MRRSYSRKALLCAVTGAVLWVGLPKYGAAVPAAARAAVEAPPWTGFEAGFDRDETVHHTGAFSLRCVNADASEKRGGARQYELNQTRATPIVITGWSRAQGVQGTADSDYAVYCDVQYDDGSNAYGYASAFDTGTHDWQQRRVTITPERPIKTIRVYALFRGHAGIAWFDDFSLTPLAGIGIFDSQPLAPPALPARASSGWFVRDVAADGALVRLTPGSRRAADDVVLTVRQEGPLLQATLQGDSATSRALTLYYVERFDAPQPLWWNTIRETLSMAGDREGTNAVTAGDAGATGTQTKYPFGCVTGAGKGRVLALPPGEGPRIARIGYHPGTHQLYIAFDLALTPARRTAPVTIARYDVSPEWGMRDAARIYYALFPEYYAKRNKVEGIWLPFTDPSHIDHVEDFGIAWHEGDNSVAADDKLGILSFRYVEPMSYWMPMAPEVKRDYPTAVAQLQRIASGQEVPQHEPEEQHRQAMAMLTSGTHASNGLLNVQFQNAPWCNGAVWTLDPNPRMPGPWNKARVNYDLADANKRYSDTTHGILDGEYLDSTEGWANVLDYGAESLKASIAPPTFDSNGFRPVLPTWFSVWEYMDWLRADLRRRGKLLMGNSTPWTIYAFAPLLDAAGTETNWLGDNGTFRPESDAFMCWRRTLSGRKAYLLLLNTDFDKFTHAYVEKYFQRCLFYGIFPSFFSVNASDKPYWENAKWYNRDRDLFKRYIPVIQQLSAAGWEPVTYARSSDPNVYLERYGRNYIAVFNATSAPVHTVVTLDLTPLAGHRPGAVRLREVLRGSAPALEMQPDHRGGRVTLDLQPDEVRVLQIEQGRG